MKKKTPVVVNPSEESLDSILDALDVVGEKPNKAKTASEKPKKSGSKAKSTDEGAKDALPKEPKVKQPRVLKGIMVTFQNKSGETITGMGTEYWVVRVNGKLHYKQADQVTILGDVEF